MGNCEISDFTNIIVVEMLHGQVPQLLPESSFSVDIQVCCEIPRGKGGVLELQVLPMKIRNDCSKIPMRRGNKLHTMRSITVFCGIWPEGMLSLPRQNIVATG